MIVQFFDPETGKYVDTYVQAKCSCGAVLTQYEADTYGSVCESCANHYYEEQQMQSQQFND